MLIESPILKAAGVRHAFFTREGGVSEGLYASLNCGLGSGDDAGRVRENRGRALERIGLGAGDLVTVHQVHSGEAVAADRPFAHEERPKADGLATATKGIALGILTADCAPVLFADTEAGVIGAAHAGWRGAFGGVLEATLAAMMRLGARPGVTVAAVGPCIRQRSYQVGPEFRAQFVAQDRADDVFFRPSRQPGAWQFDLPAYVMKRLARLGLSAMEALEHDTCADRARFFSYRRACLVGEKDYGRLLSAIALPA